jgi:hypothetical protein
MKPIRPRIDVNLEELDRVLDGARQAPLSETDYDKLKGALHALAALLMRTRTTEKTAAIVSKQRIRQLTPGLRRIAKLRRRDMGATVPRHS